MLQSNHSEGFVHSFPERGEGLCVIVSPVFPALEFNLCSLIMVAPLLQALLLKNTLDEHLLLDLTGESSPYSCPFLIANWQCVLMGS